MLNAVESNECRPSAKPSLTPLLTIKREGSDQKLEEGAKKQWEVSGHCSGLLFPAPYRDTTFSTRCANFYFLRHCTAAVPDQEFVAAAQSACFRVLKKLNQSELQIKSFILPSQLLKLKLVDPYSRQKIVNEVCKYLSLQKQLRSVVLEQARLGFSDLCRLLLSVGRRSLVKRLYLWDVLDSCNVPFKGPLQSDIVLDDVSRIPFTYNPGGRKYLRELKKKKEEAQINARQKRLAATSNESNTSKNAWDGNLAEECKKELLKRSESAAANFSGLMEGLYEMIDQRDFVYSQMDVAIQCDEYEDLTCDPILHIPRRSTLKEYQNQTLISMEDLLTKTEIECCQQYLKIYENSEIKIETLRRIYIVALSGLINLTTLSMNYRLLADGTGEALMAIGSVSRGKLKELELLCEMEDLPSSNHLQYDQSALHTIPDVTWGKVKNTCPELKVFMICSFMSTNDVTKMFITRSIPLYGVHFDNGFCPTLIKPQLMFFKTLKTLPNFKDTLEYVDIVLWHSCGRIDSSLMIVVTESLNLRSFAYHGPLQFKASLGKFCEVALSSPSLVSFKLMLQGDPCYSSYARDLTDEIYRKYLPKFVERSIHFTLGTHCS